MIPKAYIDDLVLKADIVGIIGREVPLLRSKNNFFGICPFHVQGQTVQAVKQPRTFSVSANKRFFHCFGCNAHGSVFEFLIKFKGLSFPEAVAVVAAETGVSPPEQAQSSKAAQDEFNQIAETLERALQFYEQALRSASAAIGLLKGAGITGRTAKLFRVGFAPGDWDNLRPVFKDDYVRHCSAAGLAVVKEDGTKAYDRLRNRIIFPTLNAKNQVLGMAGLAVAGQSPEYLCTSRAATKSSKEKTPSTSGVRREDNASLFGLSQANVSMHAEGFVVLLQDCLDVLRLHEAGFHNTVAPSEAGKLKTENFARLFRRTPKVVCCFPRTERGSRHAWHAMQAALPALTDDVQVRFAMLPDDMNPADVIQQQGGMELLRLLLNSAIPLSEFFLQGLAAKADLTVIEGRAKVLKQAAEMLEQVSAPHLKTQLEHAIRELVDDRLELLDSVEEHDEWLKDAIRSASTQVLIVSPWVTKAGIGRFDLCEQISTAVSRGVRVEVYTDWQFNEQRRRQSAAGEWIDDGAEQALVDAGAWVYHVSRIHSKVVAVDQAALCIGSFNWLSAAKSGTYQRHEVSLVYRQGNIGVRISKLRAEMATRRAESGST